MDTPFLLLTLFFPRILLFVYYVKGWIPANTLPFWGDVALAVFVPRILVLLYIYHNLGPASGWFWAHAVVLILCYAGGGSTASRKKE